MANNKFTLDYILNKIDECENRLCSADNNLRYIKSLKSFNLWLTRLADYPESAEYLQLFCTGFSTFDRVQNSILEYRHGNRPF